MLVSHASMLGTMASSSSAGDANVATNAGAFTGMKNGAPKRSPVRVRRKSGLA